MVDTLERPGVEVRQEFTAAPPTFIRPSLQACVIGPSNQIIEAVQDDGTLNSQAQIIMPAEIQATAVDITAGYIALAGLTVEWLIDGKPYTLTFRASPANLTPAQAVQDVLTSGIPGLTAYAETTQETPEFQRIVFASEATGDNAMLTITGGTGLTSLGLTPQEAVGASGYRNAFNLHIPLSAYPDPSDILDWLTPDYDTVRVFLDDGTGTGLEVSDPVNLRGGTAAVTVVDDGDGDTTSPTVRVAGADFTAVGTSAVATGNTFATPTAGMTLRMSVDREWWQTVTFDGTESTSALAATAINAVFPSLAADNAGNVELTSSAVGEESVLRVDSATSTALTALGFDTAGGPFETVDEIIGSPHAPQVGDAFYAAGVLVGTILNVAPGAVVTDLRLSTEVALTYTASTYRIVSNTADGAATATVPASALQVNATTGEITLAAGVFRNNDGSLIDVSGFPVYVAFNALRRDVSPDNPDFRGLRIGDLDDLDDNYGPVDTQNPLSLGIYAAMLNAPGIEVVGVGVSETTSSVPEGTDEAYAEAFEFAESLDVYSVAPLTHSDTVGQLGMTHVDFMSEPASKGERILILNPAKPTRQTDTLVASGATGNVTTLSPDDIVTGIAALPAYLSALGYPGPTYTEDDGIFVEFEDDSNRYLVASISGDTLTINSGPLADESGFYYDAGGGSVFSAAIVDRPFTVKIKGGSLGSKSDEASAYADKGRNYKNRRVIALAPDKAGMSIDGLETLVAGYYLSAALAGKFSSIAPAQPMTEQPIAGFTKVEGTTAYFSEGQLDILAGGGLWVWYNTNGGAVKCRRQVTTDLTDINTREPSITRALDFSAKFYRGSLRNFIGGVNIDTTLLESLNIAVSALSGFLVKEKVLKSAEGGQVAQVYNAGLETDETEVTVVVTVFKPHNKMTLTLLV